MSTTYRNKAGQYEAHQWDGTPGALARIEVFVPFRAAMTGSGLRLSGKPVPLYFWLVDTLDGDRSKVKIVKPDDFVAHYAPVPA